MKEGQFLKKYRANLVAVLLLSAATGKCIQAGAQTNRASGDLYLTQLKAAEAYYRLNQTGELRNVLNAVPRQKRGFEWQLLNARADRSFYTFPEQNSAVTGIAISNDGKYIASGYADHSFVLRDGNTYQVIRKTEVHKGQVTTLDFSPDGKTLVTGSSDKTLRLWDLATGNEIRNYNHEFRQGIYQCKFSNDGKMLAVVSWELVTAENRRYVQGFAKILDVQTGALIKRFDTDNHPASAVKFSADDKKVYTGTWGFYIKKHDLATGANDWVFDMNQYDYYTAIQTLDLSPDNQYLVQGGKDNKIRVLNTENGKILYQLETWQGHTQWVNSTRFSPDGKYFASASDDGLIKIWETINGNLRHVFRGHTGGISQIAWHPDGKRLFSASGDKTIKAWNTDSPGEISFKPFQTGLWYAPVSPDGNLLATATYDKQFGLWNIHTGQQHLFLDSFNCTSAAFTADGKYVAAGHQVLNLYDVATGKKIAEGKGHTGRILGMDFNDRNNLFVTAGDKSIRLWKPGDTVSSRTMNLASAPNAARFSPDGKLIYAAGTDGIMRIISTGDWQPGDSIVLQDKPVNNMAVSYNGRYVATIGEAGQARLYDTRKKKTTVLAGHVKAGHAIAFHPALPLVVTGAYDQTVRFWDAETGTNTLTLFGFPVAVYTISFTRDGKKLIITEVEGRIHIISI